MQRVTTQPRQDWIKIVEKQGLIWHTTNDKPYWNESVYYSFTGEESARLESASNTLYSMFEEAGQYIIDNNLFHKFGIPEWVVPLIVEAWDMEVPSLNYGRFDLGYDGKDIKLLEFNADTPTSLLEAAVIQWQWKEEVKPSADQFNNIHNAFLDKFTDIAPYMNAEFVHFAHIADWAGEDTLTVTYLRNIAEEAGIQTIPILMDDIGWNPILNRFTDCDETEIKTIYKLYPWEWIVNEEFGQNVAKSDTKWIEPIWKMMWSNKAILPVLWEMYPNHPLLLESYFDSNVPDWFTQYPYVRKPILSREGANVLIHDGHVLGGSTLGRTEGEYGEEGHVYQAYIDLESPSEPGRYPILGTWIVDGVCVGMGIREGGIITNNTAQFVPHVIEG